MLPKCVIQRFVEGIPDVDERARATKIVAILPFIQIGDFDAVEIGAAQKAFAQARVNTTVLLEHLILFMDEDTLFEATKGLKSLPDSEDQKTWEMVRERWKAVLDSFNSGTTHTQ